MLTLIEVYDILSSDYTILRCDPENEYRLLLYIIMTLSIGYSTFETKEAARIGYSGFLIQHEYECGKRNQLYPIRANSFVSIIMYLTCTIIVLLKKYMLWHIFLHF